MSTTRRKRIVNDFARLIEPPLGKAGGLRSAIWSEVALPLTLLSKNGFDTPGPTRVGNSVCRLVGMGLLVAF